MCSLNEAFQSFIEGPPLGAKGPRNESNVVDNSALFDYTEKSGTGKHRKKRRAALLPPEEPRVVEPDRPANRPPSVVERLSGSASTRPSQMLNALENTEYFPAPSADSADKNVYNLEPDWASVFANLPEPDWIKKTSSPPPKQITNSVSPFPVDGMPTLWQDVPNTRQSVAQNYAIGNTTGANSRLDSFQQRLDELFQKLETIESSKSESAIPEVLLFVLGGIFLILLMDILVKQGTQASLLLAAAGGARSYKRYMPFR
jgi:hypothetical protein